MLKTIRIMLSLRRAYKANTILYVIRQIPFVKKLLPATMSNSKKKKFIASLLFILWEIASVFLGNALFYGLILYSSRIFAARVETDIMYLQTLFLFTVVGLYLNVSFLSFHKDKVYAISILRINAREYTLLDLAYSSFKIIVGTMPIAIYSGIMAGAPMWFLILVPFSVAFGKLIYSFYILWAYDNYGVVKYSGNSILSWIVSIGLLCLAYAMPMCGIKISPNVCMIGMIVLIPAGMLCLKGVLRYDRYLQINKAMFAQMDAAYQNAGKVQNKIFISGIDAGETVQSDKVGLEYFNDIFSKRHKRLLWKPSQKMTAIIVTVFVIAKLIIVYFGLQRENVSNFVMNALPYFSFVVFLLNRGENYTKALFMNCDRSMLTFSFFKKRSSVVGLFKIRLREIVKINIVPGCALGLGLALLAYVPGVQETITRCFLIAGTIIVESVFFSIHYLTLYYLLQPYNINTEVKSMYYTVALIFTYALVSVFAFQSITVNVFATVALVLCCIYFIAAPMLVNVLAPRTFKLKN